MNRKEYGMVIKKMHQKPPNKETPKGQKFNIGDIVRIVNPITWFSKEHIGKTFKVEYSHSQKYDSEDIKNYSLIHLWEDNSSAWYEEQELELVK